MVLDLGRQPIADILPVQAASAATAVDFPLRLAVCQRCWLVQLADDVDVPRGVHGHGAQHSASVTEATNVWLDDLTARHDLASGRVVVVVGDDGGALTARLAERGARAFALATERTGHAADLVIAHHALTHAEHFDRTIRAISGVLAPGGAVEIEFHDVLGVIAGGQFDIACHAHRNYLSLTSLASALQRHGLVIEDAVRVATYGGSIRAFVRHQSIAGGMSATARLIRQDEHEAGIDSIEGYGRMQPGALEAREALVAFLREASDGQTTVAGYGAPARASTLLNFCAVTSASVAFTVDLDPAKQGRVLPGTGIPVHNPATIADRRPDWVLIFPWPLANEIVSQQSIVKTWGGRFVVAMPKLRILE